MFSHDHRYRVLWDMFVSCFIIYSIISIPFYIGFEITLTNPILAVEVLITVVFSLDILINFNTSYIDRDTEKVVVRRRHIALHYLQTWFFLDFFSTFPFDLLIHSMQEHATSALAAIRLVRVFRLIRVVKLYDKLTQSKFWRNNSPISPAVFSLGLLMLQIFYVTHLFACFWHYIGTVEENNKVSDDATHRDNQNSLYNFPTNWRETFHFLDHESTIGQRYVACLYYVLITMATIGYGDIYPTNDLERLFGIVTILTGVIVLSALVNRVTSVLNTINPLSSAYEQQMKQLKQGLLYVKLPLHLRKQAKVRFAFLFFLSFMLLLG